MSLLLVTAVKASIILLAALAAVGLLAKQSAAMRHWMLATAIACALLVPVLAFVVPSWRVPSVRVPDPQVDSRVEVSVTAVTPSDPNVEPRRNVPAPPTGAGIGPVLLTAWIAGTALALGVLLVGLARLAAIAASARPVGSGRCADLAQEVASEYGLRRPVRLLYGDHPALLVTWGLARPTVILPEAARTWPDDRLRVVLCHELAHIRRGDWGTQLAAELLRAAYWFNPFAWIACRRLRQESEQACDDAVLNAGVAGPAYAEPPARSRPRLLGPPRRVVAGPSCCSALRPRKESSCHAQCASQSAPYDARDTPRDRSRVPRARGVDRGRRHIRAGTIRHRCRIARRLDARRAARCDAHAHEHGEQGKKRSAQRRERPVRVRRASSGRLRARGERPRIQELSGHPGTERSTGGPGHRDGRCYASRNHHRH